MTWSTGLFYLISHYSLPLGQYNCHCSFLWFRIDVILIWYTHRKSCSNLHLWCVAGCSERILFNAWVGMYDSNYWTSSLRRHLIYGKITQKQELFPKPGIKSGDQSRKYVTYVAGYFTDNIAEIKRFVSACSQWT
jgi:hypothetical protein